MLSVPPRKRSRPELIFRSVLSPCARLGSSLRRWRPESLSTVRAWGLVWHEHPRNASCEALCDPRTSEGNQPHKQLQIKDKLNYYGYPERRGVERSSDKERSQQTRPHRTSLPLTSRSSYPVLLSKLFRSSGWTAASRASSSSKWPSLTRRDRDSSNVMDPLFLVMVISWWRCCRALRRMC